MILIYLARSALMNSVYALEESIMMDFVPKNTRATWKGLESISVFGWCGSAALGGVIADATDYPTTFLITAAVQGTGALMFALLYFIIPRDQDREKHPARLAARPTRPTRARPRRSSSPMGWSPW